MQVLVALSVLALILGLLAPAPAAASRADLAATCLETADRAADRHGVPRAVMRALTRTETGRSIGGALQPWPWTVNMEGEGRWFDDRAAALAYVERERARGARSFDVGCFQINHLWHGDAFASVAAMFEPDVNADYAARFLRGLYEESGDWREAAGLYHSRTPHFRDRYAERFARILARGDPEAPFAPVQPPAAAEPVVRAAAAPAPAASLWRAPPPPATAGAIPLAALAGARGPLAQRARGPLVSAAARPLIE
jgi:hypothetical protein